MYEITIEETKQVRKMVGKQWEVVERDGNYWVHGYTPEVENLVTETHEIYKQIVDSLDLFAVIEAVNKTPECPSHAEQAATTGFKYCPDCGNPLDTHRKK